MCWRVVQRFGGLCSGPERSNHVFFLWCNMSGRLLSDCRLLIAPLSRGQYAAALRLAASAPRGLRRGEWWRLDLAALSVAAIIDGKDRPALSASQARAMLSALVAAGIVQRDGAAVRFVSAELVRAGAVPVVRRAGAGSALASRRAGAGFRIVSDCDVIEIPHKIREGEADASMAVGLAFFRADEAQGIMPERVPASAAARAAILAEFRPDLTGRASGAVASGSFLP